jgi:hypothetical protein
MISAFVVSVALQTVWHFDNGRPRDFAWLMLITVGVTTVVWLAVTFLTAPEPKDVLVKFYRPTRPSLAGWRGIAALAPDVRPSTDGWHNLLDWIAGCVLIYGTLFGIGDLVLKDYMAGAGFLALAAVAGAVIHFDLTRRGWSAVVD